MCAEESIISSKIAQQGKHNCSNSVVKGFLSKEKKGGEGLGFYPPSYPDRSIFLLLLVGNGEDDEEDDGYVGQENSDNEGDDLNGNVRYEEVVEKKRKGKSTAIASKKKKARTADMDTPAWEKILGKKGGDDDESSGKKKAAKVVKFPGKK